jgi:glyoxylase-like metal-dependent hydrolase (beta-lactamase superfamily II)
MILSFVAEMAVSPLVTPFFDPATNTISYIVQDPASRSCAIIDPVLDFDPASGRVTTNQADTMIDHIQSKELTLEWLIETHVHADHLSSARYIQGRLGGKIGIGKSITQVQGVFGDVFGEDTSFARDGRQFDVLFDDLEVYHIGTLKAVALHTPGHTPACMTHVIGDAAFLGDTLFMPDQGSARADFPGGNARTLYHSIQRVLNLPDAMRLYMCHDYAPNGRPIAWETTVAEEKASNIHVGNGIDEDQFVAMREARDKTLGMPRLILPSLQVNMRAGAMPDPDAAGRVFLKLPINAL